MSTSNNGIGTLNSPNAEEEEVPTMDRTHTYTMFIVHPSIYLNGTYFNT